MKIVILEGETINPGDVSWSGLEAFGNLTVYPRTTEAEAIERMKGADVVLFSKINMNRQLIDSNPSLKVLCITATGYDNFDVAYAKERGIACCNVPAYATDAVAQHTFALILELTNQVGLHNQSVVSGQWNEERGFCYWVKPLHLLKGKTLGIIGYGSIGKEVAKIGQAFGMEIKIYSRNPEEALGADFVSLHIPASPTTNGFINQNTISQMKDGAFLINTARGSLIDEAALAQALKSGKLAGYGGDVLSLEPPVEGNPLIGLDNTVITPHNAWCPKETRATVCQICADNLESWVSGGTLNRLDLD